MKSKIGVFCKDKDGKSHIREIGRSKTLCGKLISAPLDKSDWDKHMADAECSKCRRIVGLGNV